MLIALLSDTHDNVANTQAALALLAPHNPGAYLHAGDMVSPWMLDLFAGLPLHFVFGNNEFDHGELRSLALARSLQCHDALGDITLDGARICLTHGHDRELPRAVRSGAYRYVIHGHTHVRRDERVGGTHIINPGALHRAAVKSVALLDLATDELRFLELPGRA
jgi:hypothetical protein